MPEHRGGGRGKGGPEIRRGATVIPRESPRVAIPSVLYELVRLLECVEPHHTASAGDYHRKLKELKRMLLHAYPGLQGPAAQVEVYLADEDDTEITEDP